IEIGRHPVPSIGGVASELVVGLPGVAANLHKRALRFAPPPMALASTESVLDLDALETELRHVAGDELQPANIQLITDGGEALAALEEAFEQATCQIDVLMYLWDSDAVGWEIAQ